MKKIFLIVAAVLMSNMPTRADEGMWMLQLLEKLNITDMRAKGLELSAKDIYNADGSSIKDAIVIFGGGCTGEVISREGLVMTNHHCGYGAVQSLSSVENDYLRYGFWAMNREEEIPAPGLQVKFIRSICDVTDRVLEGIGPEVLGNDRNKRIGENMNKVNEGLKNQNPGKQIQVKSFFGGNTYIAFIIEVFGDIRLVGTPPSSIGKFGGDTDNWMWPRHTGDFALFRIYSAPDGSPADYSPDNVPYETPVHLEISVKGYDKGDFAMIIGFPGTTERYMTSFEVEQLLESTNPTRIFVRGVRQQALAQEMEASDEVRIKYASKYASSANYWKNSIGMNLGLRKLGTKAQKEAQEQLFTRWVAANPERTIYRDALSTIERSVCRRTVPQREAQFISEAMLLSLEIMRIPPAISGMMPHNDENLDESRKQDIIARAESLYRDYDRETERKVAKAMFRIVADSLPESARPGVFKKIIDRQFGGDIDAYIDYLYDNSHFATQEKLTEALENGAGKDLKTDPAYVLSRSVMDAYSKAVRQAQEANNEYADAHRLYVAGLTRMQKDKVHYPDANFSIRLTFGSILPYDPADGVTYNYFTTLKGVVDKEDPSNPTEFTVPEKLKELYNAHDYGHYGDDGVMHINFLTNNDITGGNSGSPVLDSKGRLIGLAFDGNWEAMTGDIAFEPDMQRCINVDIRYVLFIIDKFAGAGHLIDEMSIAR